MLYVVSYPNNSIERLQYEESGSDVKSRKIVAFSKDGEKRVFPREEIGSTIFFSRSAAVFNLRRHWGLRAGLYPLGIDTDMIAGVIPKKYRDIVVSEDFIQDVFLAICEGGDPNLTFEEFKDIVKVCVDRVVREKAPPEVIIDASDAFVLEDPFESCTVFLPLYLEQVLSTLTPLEQRILRLRFGLCDGVPKSLEEVAHILNEEGAVSFKISRERVRMCENKALIKLRRPSCSKILRDFYR